MRLILAPAQPGTRGQFECVFNFVPAAGGRTQAGPGGQALAEGGFVLVMPSQNGAGDDANA
jgi:hypothetical protein